MKHFLLLAGLLLSGFIGSSQVAINTDGSLPNPNAILDLKSGTLGLLLPRTDSLSRMAIPNIGGMIIYDSTTGSPWYNSGLTWVNLGSTGGGGGWSLTGNAGTVDGTNFFGTTDNTALTFRVNNQQSGRIDQRNTFFGYQSGISFNYASQGNSGYGFQSLYSNTYGTDNVAVGYESLYSNNNGGLNVAVGYESLYANTGGEENVAVGYGSMQFNTSGSNNSALGYSSLNNNSTGASNTAIGYLSLNNNTTGYGNVAVGNSASYASSTGAGIVAIGDSALMNNTAGGNTAIGYQALEANTTGVSNVATGAFALLNANTGSYNTADGYNALYANTTGGDNTADGYNALYANTTGIENTATGAYALGGNISGNTNSAFGLLALSNNITGNNLTAIGFSAGVSVDGLSDATAIGAYAAVGSSYTIQLGDALVTAVNSAGTFNTISDGRFKFNIQEDVRGLDFIMKLRPVTYQLDTRKIRNSQLSGSSLVAFTANHNSDDLRSMRIRRTGFIAQEVEKAADSTGFDFDAVKKPENDRDHYSLSYEEFVVPLVKAVQEQQEQIEDLKKEQEQIEDLKKEIEDLKKIVATLSKK